MSIPDYRHAPMAQGYYRHWLGSSCKNEATGLWFDGLTPVITQPAEGKMWFADEAPAEAFAILCSARAPETAARLLPDRLATMHKERKP